MLLTNAWRPIVYVLTLALTSSVGLNAAVAEGNYRTSSNVRMAYGAIVSSFLNNASGAQSDKGASLAASPDSALLGLAVVDEATRRGDPASLTNLLMFKRDGEFAENFQCLVLGDGARARTALKAINPIRLNQTCSDFVKKIEEGSGRENIPANNICWSADHIRQESNDLATAIDRHRRCHEQ